MRVTLYLQTLAYTPLPHTPVGAIGDNAFASIPLLSYLSVCLSLSRSDSVSARLCLCQTLSPSDSLSLARARSLSLCQTESSLPECVLSRSYLSRLSLSSLSFSPHAPPQLPVRLPLIKPAMDAVLLADVETLFVARRERIDEVLEVVRPQDTTCVSTLARFGCLGGRTGRKTRTHNELGPHSTPFYPIPPHFH